MDLPEDTKKYAVRGFVYAMKHRLADLTQWRDGYCSYIVEHENVFVKLAEKDEEILRFMMDEKLLSEESVFYLLDKVTRPDLVASILTYQNEQFRRRKGP